MARSAAAGYLMTHDPGFSPMDEMAETPAACARSVSTKRQEGIRRRRRGVDRFTFTATSQVNTRFGFTTGTRNCRCVPFPRRNPPATAIQTP